MLGRRVAGRRPTLDTLEVAPDLIVTEGVTLEGLSGGGGVYINRSGYFGRALASGSSTMQAIGVAIAAVSSGSRARVVVRGVVHSLLYSFSGLVGGQAYVSRATAGAIANTDVTTSGELVQVIGYIVDQSGVYVNPGDALQRGAAVF